MAMEQLLEILQDQATLTTAQLAAMLGEKEEDVVKAIKKYEKEGVIKGYQALINWAPKCPGPQLSSSCGSLPKRTPALTKSPAV